MFGCESISCCQNSHFMSAPEEKAMGHVEVNVFRKSLLKVQSSAVKGFLKVVSFT